MGLLQCSPSYRTVNSCHLYNEDIAYCPSNIVMYLGMYKTTSEIRTPLYSRCVYFPSYIEMCTELPLIRGGRYFGIFS